MDIMQKNLEKMKRILEHEQEVEDMNKRVNVISGELTDLDAEKNRLIMTSKLRPLKEKEIAEKQRELEEIKRVIALKEADLTRDKKELKDNMKASLQAEMDLYVYQEDMDKMRQAVEEKKASILKEADDLTPIIEGYEAQKEKLQKEKERFEKIKTQIEQKITNGETVPDSHLSNAVSNIYFYQSRIDEFDRKIQSITEEIETKIEDIHNEKAELSKYKVLEDHVEEYSELENLFVRLDNNFDVAKEVEALEKDSEPEVDPIPEETSGVFGDPVLSQEESSEPVANPEPAEEPISEEDWPEYDFSSAEEMPEEVGLSSEEVAEIFGETQGTEELKSISWYIKQSELKERVLDMSEESFAKLQERMPEGSYVKLGNSDLMPKEEFGIILDLMTEEEFDEILNLIEEIKIEKLLEQDENKPEMLSREELAKALEEMVLGKAIFPKYMERIMYTLEDRMGLTQEEIAQLFEELGETKEEDKESKIEELRRTLLGEEQVPSVDLPEEDEQRAAYEKILSKGSGREEDKSLTAPPETRMEKFVGFVGGIVGHIPGAKWVAKKAKALWKKVVGFFKAALEEEEVWDESYDEEFEDVAKNEKGKKSKEKEKAKDKKKRGKEQEETTQEENVQEETKRNVREMVESRSSRDEGFEKKWNTGELKTPVQVINKDGKKVWLIPGEKSTIPVEKDVVPDVVKEYRKKFKEKGSLDERLRNEEAAAKVGNKKCVEELMENAQGVEDEELDSAKGERQR